MALTENTFTPEEFTAAVAANPELVKTVSTVLTGQKFVIHNETEHQTYLKNYEANVISQKTNEFATNLEKDVEELTGIKKANPQQKYYEYLKEAVGKKLGTVTQMEAELKTLKEKGGNTSELDKQRIAALEKGLQEKEATYKDALTKKEQELATFRSLTAIEKALSPIRAKYKPTIPKEVIEMAEQVVIADVQKRYKLQDNGTETLIGDDGKAILNAAFAPMSISEYLTEKVKTMIDEGKKAEGAGSKSEQSKPGESGEQKKWDGQLPTGVRTKVELSEYLYSIGVTSDSKEYSEAMEKHKALPMR